MWTRAIPYALIWLDAVLLLGEGAPDLVRTGVAVVGVFGALVMRASAPPPLVTRLCASIAVAAPAVLLATAAHPILLARSTGAAVFGLLALYCLMRAIRG